MSGPAGGAVSGPADRAASGPAAAQAFSAHALAIHNLEDADKRALMSSVNERLAPGGAFVNAEQVSAPSPALTEIYEQRWARECRALGAGEQEFQEARERMRHDRCVDVERQLRWMREAGFATVDCVYKSWRFAVMVGFKEA